MGAAQVFASASEALDVALAVLASEMLARSWQPDRPGPAGGKTQDRQPEEPRDESGGDDRGSDAGGREDAGDAGDGSGGGDGQPDADGSSDGVFEDRALKL